MLQPKPVSAPLPRLVSFARALTIGRRRLAVLATIFGFPGLYAWDAVTGSKVPFALDLIVSLALLSMTRSWAVFCCGFGCATVWI